jgi:hypothetical protein
MALFFITLFKLITKKSMGSQEWNMRQPYGIIDGWSIGLASKWSGINFKGITLDIRWAIHA